MIAIGFCHSPLHIHAYSTCRHAREYVKTDRRVTKTDDSYFTKNTEIFEGVITMADLAGRWVSWQVGG